MEQQNNSNLILDKLSIMQYMKYKKPVTFNFIVNALLIVIIHSSTNFKLTLSSATSQQTKEIFPLPSFSCQLPVFGVYNNTYQARIEILEQNYQYFKMYFQTSSKCLFYNLSQTQNIVEITVNDTNFAEYTQITQTIYMQLSNDSQHSENCTQIKNNGQKRRIYLVDKDNQNQFSYGIRIPQQSVIITQIFAYLVLLIFSHNIKYRRFIPKKFGFLMAIFYSFFLFAIVYISTFMENDLNIIYYCTMAVSFFAMTIYLIDFTSCFIETNFIIYSSSIIIASTIIFLDMVVFPNAWFLNDLIAIMLAGTFIKFVVIKKIKAAILPLTILWIFFIVRQFAIEFHIQNFQKALEVKISPLHLQLPASFQDHQFGYQCSAFGTSKIIIIGLIFNYAVRIDLFLSTKFYTILISIISFICLGLQVIISIFLQDLPFMEFMSIILFLPIAIPLMLFFSSKRGEWAEIWHGSFHDIAIDRKSVKRQSSELTTESINKNLDLLKMNASLLSD